MPKGRPKGAKSVGIPLRGIKDAIELVKMVYDNAGTKTMSFAEMTNYMKLQKASSTPVVGALYEYGLIERSGIGWRLSELGMLAVKGDKEAVKEAFEKNPIFRDLSIEFFDKEITEGIVIDYLRKKYKKGENVFLIAKRFLEAIQYIKGLSNLDVRGKAERDRSLAESVDTGKWFKLIQLKYALDPPSESEIDNLVDAVADELSNDSDVSIKTLAISVRENKNDRNSLKLLIDNIVKILSQKYPNLILGLRDKKQKTVKED